MCVFCAGNRHCAGITFLSGWKRRISQPLAKRPPWKSAAMGIRRPWRSPMTAKLLLKVHLRLWFQNLGKPRTAGLCGWKVVASDHLPLSCAKIERPSPFRKSTQKVRNLTQNHFHKYRQKVIATNSIPNHFLFHFSTSLTNGPRSLSLTKAGTHSPHR